MAIQEKATRRERGQHFNLTSYTLAVIRTGQPTFWKALHGKSATTHCAGTCCFNLNHNPKASLPKPPNNLKAIYIEVARL
eukprot:CAMPEP_0171806584 /NCGR_PEP_ID=MMETSP0991-20121206/75389_1 /TAXON_ID=483369 /ORGANISM="non described non described, Strain CCMP2098" /LENGTH=79 /DNA_ID=CAMNT_0012419367 /DNA_START=851 /DNA_END=1086 /DNA_ORIENTATION=-